jgi:DNA-binding CsgD family transcriptional regulator
MVNDADEIESIITAEGYLTPKQAAAYLQVTTKTLADYRSNGRKPDFIKRGQTIRYAAQAIIDFIIQRNETKRMPEYDQLLIATQQYGNHGIENSETADMIETWQD